MNHERVKSSNVFSLAHEGDTLEARFRCGKCGATGTVDGKPCSICEGRGHGATYRYSPVPIELHGRLIAGDHGIDGRGPSVGTAFLKHIRGSKHLKVEKI